MSRDDGPCSTEEAAFELGWGAGPSFPDGDLGGMSDAELRSSIENDEAPVRPAPIFFREIDIRGGRIGTAAALVVGRASRGG